MKTMIVFDFFRSFKDEFGLSDNAIAILQSEFEEVFVQKGTVILEQGASFYDLIFLVKGVVFSSIDRGEKEIIPYFGFDGDLIAIPLKDNFRSSASLTAIEDCIVLKIKIKHFENIIQTNTELAFMSYRLFKKLLSEVAKEYMDYSGVEAKEQYLKIIEENPSILNRVPLKYIASNIGITPSSLSRIRAQTSDGVIVKK